MSSVNLLQMIMVKCPNYTSYLHHGCLSTQYKNGTTNVREMTLSMRILQHLRFTESDSIRCWEMLSSLPVIFFEIPPCRWWYYKHVLASSEPDYNLFFTSSIYISGSLFTIILNSIFRCDINHVALHIKNLSVVAEVRGNWKEKCE